MTKKESPIAAMILALVACAFGLILWSMRLDAGVSRIGPMKVLRAGGDEWVTYFLANRFNVLDAQGARVAQQPLAELQLTEEPTDIDFTVDAQGRVQAWLFEDTTPRIVRCDWEAQHRRLERCAQVLAGAQLKTNAASIAVHLAVDAARARVFVADANGGARALSLDGRVLADSPSGLLFFPNRVRVAGDTLMVADNDHRRMLWLDISGERPTFALQRQLPSVTHAQGRSGHRKVTDFVYRAPQGGRSEALWMLAVAQGQKDGDILLFGPGLQSRARADLGGFGDPLMIDAFGDGILAADYNGVALYRIGEGGEFRGVFGDAAVLEDHARVRADIARMRWIGAAGWSLLAASIVLGFVLAIKYREPPPRPQLAAVSPEGAEIGSQPIVLMPDARFTRRIRRLAAFAVGASLLAVLVPSILITAYRTEGAAPPFAVRSIAFAVAAALVSAGFFWWLGRITQRHLVASREGLEIFWKDRVLARGTWNEVWASADALLVGRMSVPYRQPRTLGRAADWVFDEEQLTRHVLARIPPHQYVSVPQLRWRNVRNLPVWQQAIVAVGLLAYLAVSIWMLMR